LYQKAFRRARSHARAHLRSQLDDFQKRIKEGLGNFYGCGKLEDVEKDKEKEAKFVESTLQPFVKEYL
jgi:hypothetical protein